MGHFAPCERKYIEDYVFSFTCADGAYTVGIAANSRLV